MTHNEKYSLPPVRRASRTDPARRHPHRRTAQHPGPGQPAALRMVCRIPSVPAAWLRPASGRDGRRRVPGRFPCGKSPGLVPAGRGGERGGAAGRSPAVLDAPKTGHVPPLGGRRAWRRPSSAGRRGGRESHCDKYSIYYTKIAWISPHYI